MKSFASILVGAFALVPCACSEAPIVPLCPPEDDACLAGLACGDGVLDDGETCDDSELYCSKDCSEYLGRCGDGIVQEEFGEQCDSGGSGDGGGNGEGGSGGDGAGGSSSSPSMPGCSESCQTEAGFLCDAQKNECAQTGVSPDEIAADHLEEVCTWIIGLMGGPEKRVSCEVGEDVYNLRSPDLETCTDELELNDSCTIGEYEEWAIGKTPCEIHLEEPPCLK